MTINNYLDYVADDEKLYSVIGDKIPELKKLNSEQVEKLVFYLKSLYNYYPSSEGDWTRYDDFSKKLEDIKTSKEQIDLQHKALKLASKGVVCCVFAGISLTVGVVLLATEQTAVGVFSMFLALYCAVYADSKLFHKALTASKEQDRKYFLECIRAAKSCEELGRVGIFYNGTERYLSDQEIEVLAKQLRDALYNDKWNANL